MPVPTLVKPEGYLPPGDHSVTWAEVVSAFGDSPRRRQLLEELFVVLHALKSKGVKRVWLDGSFATAISQPHDIDVIYESPPGADVTTWGYLSPGRRAELRHLTGVDLWRYPSIGPHGWGPTKTIKDFFSTDRDGNPRGMLLLDLQENFP